ncbi:cytochrome c oxidase assembly protein [Micromonospora polyrhachis]
MAHSASEPSGLDWLPVLLSIFATMAYLVAAARAGRTPTGWSPLRTAAFVTGMVLLAVALSPTMAARAHHDIRVHMVQHLFVGMYAPLAITLAAPVTLLLRSAPLGSRRRVAAILRNRSLHLLGHPLTALLLNIGGLYLIYLTPLYALATTNETAHIAVHVHVLAAGYLFTWSIAGPDPAPRRPGLAVRLTVLVVAGAAHSALAKLLYAQASHWPAGVTISPVATRDAAQLMYYGGDLAEVLLAVALFAAWYRRRARRVTAVPGEVATPA